MHSPLGDLGRVRAAVVDATHCHYPVAATATRHTTARLRLSGVRSPLCFTRVSEAPFATAFRARWHAASRQQIRRLTEEAALQRALWLAQQLADQWRRSLDHGLPYANASELQCPVPLPVVPQPPAPPEASCLPPLPVLVWFGWVYPLQPSSRGSLCHYNRRYALGSPVRLSEWQAALDAEVDRAAQAAVTRDQGAAASVPEDTLRLLADFRRNSARGREVVFYADDRLKVRAINAGATFHFSLRYDAYCLEDPVGLLYQFSAGYIEIVATPEQLSQFIASPADCFPCAFIRPDRPDELNPFVREGDNALCENGHFVSVIGNPVACPLAPPGKLLRALQDGARILRTGGGNVRHTPYRSLEQSRAPVIDRAVAQERKLPIIRWRHEERGKEVVRVG